MLSRNCIALLGTGVLLTFCAGCQQSSMGYHCLSVALMTNPWEDMPLVYGLRYEESNYPESSWLINASYGMESYTNEELRFFEVKWTQRKYPAGSGNVGPYIYGLGVGVVVSSYENLVDSSQNWDYIGPSFYLGQGIRWANESGRLSAEIGWGVGLIPRHDGISVSPFIDIAIAVGR